MEGNAHLNFTGKGEYIRTVLLIATVYRYLRKTVSINYAAKQEFDVVGN